MKNKKYKFKIGDIAYRPSVDGGFEGVLIKSIMTGSYHYNTTPSYRIEYKSKMNQPIAEERLFTKRQAISKLRKYIKDIEGSNN